MAEIVNPFFNRIVNQQVRPMAERARNLLILAQASASTFAAIEAELASADSSDVIQDGRFDEDGIPPITVGQFRDCMGILSDLVTQINSDPRLASILSICVREVPIN